MTVTAVNQLTYTAQFGNGVSGSISLEDPTAYRQSNLYNLGAGGVLNGPAFQGGAYGLSALGGTRAPDIVGVLKIDQAWGVFQLSATAHNNHAAYYGITETTGHPDDKWGWAVQGALQIKNIPTGPGDTINIAGCLHRWYFSSQLPELGWAELRDVRRHQRAGRLPERWPCWRS